MRNVAKIRFSLFLLFVGLSVPGAVVAIEPDVVSHRLPPEVLPVLGCWFWQEPEFEPEGYRDFIDLVAEHAPYNLLTTSLRIQEKELTDGDVHTQIKAAAVYARDKGVPMVMDLDVRLARQAFAAEYPDELQEMLILRETELSNAQATEIEVRSHDLNDHYTHRTTHYISMKGAVLRVYGYDCGSAGIEPETLKDITERCIVTEASPEKISVRIPPRATRSRFACVMVSFTHLTPDVFAPHLVGFQRQVIRRYGDAPLAGVCKDEWGFPPNFDGNPAKNEYWYSRYRAEAYAKRTGGRELLRDCLLMHRGIRGRERERQRAINQFMEMSRERNGALEDDFYRTVKAVFGPDAIVATHPTWWPYPDLREFKKNGLHWWIATRDWAQTDEVTPYGVRTALAKKWGSPVWYNMFYSSTKADYERSVWAAVLAGGRINYHPPWPTDSLAERRRMLLRGDLMRAECRVRLLNFISQGPLNSPVAVVFGQARAMNWAGPAYNDVGMELIDSLWGAGYPADLIPSHEIENGSLRVSGDGWVQYGQQRYAAVVLYRPEFDNAKTATFFQGVKTARTALFRVGSWTADFEANDFGGDAALPEAMHLYPDAGAAVSAVLETLRERGIQRQTPSQAASKRFEHVLSEPPARGFCHLTDGTLIHVSGERNVVGDPLRLKLDVKGTPVEFDAVGVAAVRLSLDGKFVAMAAGGLKSFSAGDVRFTLERPTDMALWRNADGSLHGVLQGNIGPIPKVLKTLTADWTLLDLPPALPDVAK